MIKISKGSFLDKLAGMTSIYRNIEQNKSEDYPTARYTEFSGELLGYLESDEHFRKRVRKLYDR